MTNINQNVVLTRYELLSLARLIRDERRALAASNLRNAEKTFYAVALGSLESKFGAILDADTILTTPKKIPYQLQPLTRQIHVKENVNGNE